MRKVDHRFRGRVLPGTAILLTTLLVSVLLGAGALALAWRSYGTSVEAARRTAASNAYEAAVSASAYLQGRLDMLTVYRTRGSFVVGDPATVPLDLANLTAPAGFDAGAVWFDLSGEAVASTRRSSMSDPLLRSEVGAVLADGARRITPVVRSAEPPGSFVALLVPTLDSSGEVNGVLAGAISTAWIDDVAERQGARRGTESFVFDERGTLVATPGDPAVVRRVPPLSLSTNRRGSVALVGTTGATDPLGRGDRTIGVATDGGATGWTSVEVTSDRAALGPARRSFERSALAVGMFVGAALLGAALVARRSNELARRARRAEEELVVAADREREVAVTLQESLLPRGLPSVPGLDLVARYRAAGPDVVVGGDFYDMADLGGGRWQILLGDVCGHGVAAAAATSLARHTLRVAGRHTAGPGEWLRWLHQELASLQNDGFVTAIVMEVQVLDAGARLRIAVAGHPLPLLVPAGGEPVVVGMPGTLLGVVPPVIHETVVWLGPGDRLVAYTDGLTDSAVPRLNDDEIVGLVRGLSGLDAPLLADRLLAAASTEGRDPYDDTALIVVGVPSTTQVARADEGSWLTAVGSPGAPS